MKIGNMEKECVEKSVRCGLQIVKEDLEYINLLDDDNTVNNTHNMEGAVSHRRHYVLVPQLMPWAISFVRIRIITKRMIGGNGMLSRAYRRYGVI